MADVRAALARLRGELDSGEPPTVMLRRTAGIAADVAAADEERLAAIGGALLDCEDGLPALLTRALALRGAAARRPAPGPAAAAGTSPLCHSRCPNAELN